MFFDLNLGLGVFLLPLAIALLASSFRVLREYQPDAQPRERVAQGISLGLARHLAGNGPAPGDAGIGAACPAGRFCRCRPHGPNGAGPSGGRRLAALVGCLIHWLGKGERRPLN